MPSPGRASSALACTLLTLLAWGCPKAGGPSCPLDASDGWAAFADRSAARQWDEVALSAIRLDLPRPTVHARNLFHLSAAVYDAWAAYDTTATGVFVQEKIAASSVPDLEKARAEAVSHAAYAVLLDRYGTATGGDRASACFRSLMSRLGYDASDISVTGSSPAALGNRIAARVIASGLADGANQQDNYADTTGFVAANQPLALSVPGNPLADVNHWQPLAFSVQQQGQNGTPIPGSVQVYVGAQWREVRPFALVRPAGGGLYHQPDPAPVLGDDEVANLVEVLQRQSELDTSSTSTIDLSPGFLGANSLGANDGTGHVTNPITQAPYASNVVPLSDFGRVLAEYWADGPTSETPPGHWNLLANQVSDNPLLVKRLCPSCATLAALEWDVKLYLALNGALHDAAITAWEIKRDSTTIRPISLVRYLAGQPSGGLPLTPGLIEQVTDVTSAPGGRHELVSLPSLGRHLAGSSYLGEIVVRGWTGDSTDPDGSRGGVGWVVAAGWVPYQRSTFVTPAFPGYISGHSTFSRAGAEVLADLTGSAFFPGGLGEAVIVKDKGLQFETGPSVDVHLQWGTYYDAADQAGQSRLWGGIHIRPDDFIGRRLGSLVGKDAAALARKYFGGAALPPQP
jgi:hypothetical protein